MVHLVSVYDGFQAQLIAARLGADGILTEIRPPLGGPYPLVGEVRVYVGEADASLARDLLLADEATPAPEEEPMEEQARPQTGRARMAACLALVAVALVVLLVALGQTR